MWTFLGLSSETTQAGEGRSKVYFCLFYGIMLTCCPICVSGPSLQLPFFALSVLDPTWYKQRPLCGLPLSLCTGFPFLAIFVWETDSTSHAVRRFRPLWIQLQVSCLTKKRNLQLPHLQEAVQNSQRVRGPRSRALFSN